MSGIEEVALHEAARWRYLNYAMSVITARALPDVRDGLKPVQRRILYAMYHNLSLRPEGRYRKSAAVVGEVMAKYHPHGDVAIYEAMVRMAQPFSLLHPLVDGHGNFGSPDGDGAAAMRYTECRLTSVSIEMLRELGQRTVDFRASYDGQNQEPVVLPARFPQLLVNGCEGIAVGMATRIPPHNLREVVDACLLLIDRPEATLSEVCQRIRGPDFPTGGVLISNPAEIEAVYAAGSGAIEVRGEWACEKKGRRHHVILTSYPFGLNKASLVEKIGELVSERKLPQVLDVRDESAEDTRIVLELRNPEDAGATMAYLYRHTALAQTWHVNLTVLVPARGGEVSVPARVDLATALRHWLDFRFETVRRRFEYDLRRLGERIHVLEGFEAVFVNLDEAIRIIRASEGRLEAAEQLMARFGLDDVQADAVLELKLYRLSRLEILEIRQELEERRAEAARIEAILSDRAEVWAVVRDELLELRHAFGQPRRTRIGARGDETPAYQDDAYIVAEDAFAVVTRDGWLKRQSSFSGLERIRLREGDAIAWLLRASTRSTLAFFTSTGSAYVLRVDDLPATTGYGEPLQKHFQFGDKERVVGVVSFDTRQCPPPPSLAVAAEGEGPVEEASDDVDEPLGGDGSALPDVPPPWGVAVSRRGRVVRFPLFPHVEVSTRSGRRYMRLPGRDDAVVAVEVSLGGERVSLATTDGHALSFPVEAAHLVRGPGKGMMAIKLKAEDRVMAFGLARHRKEGVLVRTSRGREVVVSGDSFDGPRAGRGRLVLQRGGFVEWIREPVVATLGDPRKAGEPRGSGEE
ncbi:MAG: DNA topoisomerase 4 subunit A [Deltaproteobacteria bacterium]|nr:DNA topoisomerase 4 subunit A [Deltaproteobacteria bacterium]